MTIDFYYFEGSAPCRVVLLAAKAIGVELNPKALDFKKGEHRTPEFLKINPQHTLPTIVDNGFALWESRAIITYLQNKYGKDDSLYPKDPQKRAVVDQRLYFDASTLYINGASHYYPTIFHGAAPDPKKIENLENSIKTLDNFLKSSEYVAGDKLTLADLSLTVTISTLQTFGHDLSPYPNITKWYSKVQKAVPGYDEIENKHLAILRHAIAEQKKKE